MKTGFEQEVRSSLAGKTPEPLIWCYVTFVRKPKRLRGGGEFLGAAVVEAPNHIKAVDVVYDRHLIPSGGKIDKTLDIRDDKVPAEKYRNRLLTRQEVETLWPGVKG